MGAFSQLSAYFTEGIVAVARKLRYSEENLLILQNKERELQCRFPETYENLLSCEHNKDYRTPMEYGQDLVASWVFEDYTMQALLNAGLDIEKAGADKNRIILPHAKISTHSDYFVTWCDEKVLLELMSDYTGFWSRESRMHLRNDKYLALKEHNSLFLGIDTQGKKFLFLDFTEPMRAQYIEHHRPYGDKPAYEITLPDGILKPLKMERIIKQIKLAIISRQF